MTELKSSISKLVTEEKEKKIRSVKEWLATGSPPKDDHEKFLKERERYPSTGRWILEQEYILNWMGADVPITPLVWMTGIPGAGKS
jgi:hypothetical protein